jgi:SAM-dependent methyltransferase
VARSAVEAALTPDETLRVAPEIIARYVRPPADTAYPLEYAFHELGDVTDQRVVDFGCGSGANTALLANRGALVYGLDISRDLLRIAQRRLAISGCAAGVALVAASAHDLPFPDESIDVMFGMAILHHVDLLQVSREVRRVLRPGGRGIFQEPVRNSRLFRALRRLIPHRAPDVSPYERPLTDEDVRRFARGFGNVTVRAFGLPHVRATQVIPVLRPYVHAAHAWDRRLLRAAPWLARYAAVQVISLRK